MQTQRRVCIFIDAGMSGSAGLHERYKKEGECRVYQRSGACNTQLLADLLIGARDNMYDIAILVSDDHDLLPAMRYIKNRLGKEVILSVT